MRVLAWILVFVASLAAAQKPPDPERFRGPIQRIDSGSITVQNRDGRTVRLALTESTTIFKLEKASWGEIDFGAYVGAVSERLGDEIYSPIRRDSLSWLHKGLELRVIDESLRGIAVGHTKWDLTGTSMMTHGWIDDIEDRVLSIKYGPTDEEETDIEIGRDVPIVRMSRGDRSLVRAGARVFAGALKGADGGYQAVFLFIGKDGVQPAM